MRGPAKDNGRIKGLKPLLATMLLVFATASVVNGQGPHRASTLRLAQVGSSTSFSTSTTSDSAKERRTSQLVCGLSLYFSADSSDRIYTVNPRTGTKQTRLDGRGLLKCSNDQGFTSEYPVLADLDISLPSTVSGTLPAFSLAAESSPFVIPREASQIQDVYAARDGFAAVRRDPDPKLSALLRGRAHDLVIGIDFTSPGTEAENLKVLGLNLRFDDSAPDLF